MRPGLQWVCCCLVSSLACAEPSLALDVHPEPSPESSPEPSPESSEQAEPEQAEPAPAIQALTPLAVYHDDFARAELYSWTTAEQLVELRQTRRLLVADAATGGWSSPFNRALMAIERDGSETAQVAALLLEHPQLKRRRYAWPNPFATSLGLGARRYGDSLIRVELDPRALIGRFEPHASSPFSFVDMGGRAVATAEALAEPERIAALYHLDYVDVEDEPEVAYREYVICSEAMIREWSVATPVIRARVDHELALLDALGLEFSRLPRAAFSEQAAPDWQQAQARPTPLSLWHASLAFDKARYRPSPANFEVIAEALRGYVDDKDGAKALVHRPGGQRSGS